jgi:hypothetical protein
MPQELAIAARMGVADPGGFHRVSPRSHDAIVLTKDENAAACGTDSGGAVLGAGRRVTALDPAVGSWGAGVRRMTETLANASQQAHRRSYL